jgi:replicative DNA helicase
MDKEKKAFTDKAAEISVLSGIFRHGYDSYVDVSDLIDANVFTDSFNGALYKSIDYHYKDGDRPLDLPSILSAAKACGVLEIIDKPEEKRHLRSYQNFPIEKDTVRREAGKLVKLRIAEMIDEISAQARRDLRGLSGDESLNTIVGILENPLFEYVAKINSSEMEGPKHIAYGVDEYLDNLENNPRDIIGISSGFGIYDTCIGGGYRRGTVNIVAARPKTGKTVFTDNVALHVAGVLGIPVLNLDTEMSREEHMARILSHLSQVPIKEIESGKYATDHVKRNAVRAAAKYLKTIPYEYESVINKSFEEQVATIRRWVLKNVGTDERGRTKDCLVVYDYLQLTDASEFGNGEFKEYQILGFQMLSLLRLAARCDIPILSMLQLNRDGIDKETTAGAAGSDRIIWKCANFTILKKKSEEELAEEGGAEEGNLKLVPVICRHGEGLGQKDYINLKFDGSTAKLVEGRTRNEVAKGKKSGSKGFEVEYDEEKPDDNADEEKPKRRGRKKKTEPDFE